GIGSIAKQPARELQLLFIGKARQVLLDDELGVDELRLDDVEVLGSVSTEQMADRPGPEVATEDAAQAHGAARVRAELSNARLAEQEDPIGDLLALTSVLGADKLLEPEG